MCNLRRRDKQKFHLLATAQRRELAEQKIVDPYLCNHRHNHCYSKDRHRKSCLSPLQGRQDCLTKSSNNHQGENRDHWPTSKPGQGSDENRRRLMGLGSLQLTAILADSSNTSRNSHHPGKHALRQPRIDY